MLQSSFLTAVVNAQVSATYVAVA